MTEQINLMQGLGIAVGAGVTTSVIIGVWQGIRKVIDRREQVSYIREIIESYADNIYSETDIPPPPIEGAGPIPAAVLIYLRYINFREELKIAFSSRSSALTYKQLASLQEKLQRAEITLSNLKFHERKALPLEFAADIYENFQKLDWLTLPSRKEKS